MSTTYRCDLCGVTVRNIGDIEAMHLGNSNTKCQWQGDVCKRCRNRLSRAKAKAEISEMQTIKDENKAGEGVSEYIINTASMDIDRKNEIVRCRDCKLWATELRYMGKCTGKDGKLNPNGYCAWGERKEPV